MRVQPALPCLFRLNNSKCLVFYQPIIDDLFATRGPIHFHVVNLTYIAETKIERQSTLCQVAGLAVVVFRIRVTASLHADRGAKSVSVGCGTHEGDFKPMNPLLLRQVAHQHLGLGIEVIGDDVEVSVVVQIKDDGGPAGTGSHHRRFAAMAHAYPAIQFLLSLSFPGIGAINLKPRRVEIFARLNTKQELGVQKLLALIVQKHGVNSITVGVAHAGSNEDVVPAVGVDITYTRTPGPIGLNSALIGYFLIFAATQIVVESIAPDVIGLSALNVGIRPGDERF